jgi:drug/metabolite transporter (DMT)-like permease
MPIGLSFGLGAALAWGLTDIFGALAGRRLGSLPVIAGAQLVSLILLVGLAVVTGGSLPSDTGVLLMSVLMGVTAAIAYITFFTALRIGPIAVVSPTVAAYGGLTVILAVIFRGESLNAVQALGAVLATMGVVFAGLSFDGGLRKTRLVGPGVLLASVALVMFAITTVGLAAPIQSAGWFPVILTARIANTSTVWLLFAIVLVVGSRHFMPLLRTSQARGRGALVIVAAAGVMDLLGFISYAVGLEVAETWLVGLASSFGPGVAVVFAVVFLGERPRPLQWLGIGAIAAGLVAVAVG